MKRGVFVTFEGPEGSGKSTQAKRLATRLRDSGRDVCAVREPGGTATGEMIRGILQSHASGEHVFPETEALLFAASRAQLVRAVILPALARDACVVCDRFADSTSAYQGYGRGFGLERMLAINDFAADGAVPDVTVLLDLEVSKGFERLRGRNRRARIGPDRIEQEDRAFHETVRAGYLEMVERWPDRIRRVDADRDEGVVHAEVWAIVQGILTRDGP